jgi:hypothetical protein
LYLNKKAGSLPLPAPPCPKMKCLAAPATMESATSMGSTAMKCVPVEAAVESAVHCWRCTEAMSNVAMSNIAMCHISAAISDTRASVPGATPSGITNPRTTTPAIRPAPVSQPNRTMEPGAGANEHSACEPIRSVVAVGSASVWVVSVVAIGADRSRPHGNADRSHSNSDTDSDLRL